MKLKTLLLSLAACLTVGATAQEANVYASGLKANKIDGNQYEIAFVLNAPASVTLNVGDKTFDLGDCAKGANTMTVALEGVVGENLPWSITATADGATDDTVTKIGNVAFTSTRGIAVDNNMESPYFGNIYVCETKSDSETGVMVYNAAFEGDGTVYGGNAGFTSSAASPQRVFVGEDALYFCDWSDAHANVYKADPADLTKDFTLIFGGNKASSGLRTTDDGTQIAGSVVSLWVKGAGEDAVLYTFDEDYGNGNVLLQYNIGLAETPWVAAPTAEIFNDPDNLMANGSSCILPDATGWWISQYRYSETAANPALIHVTNEGVVDFNSATAGENGGQLVGNSQNGGMAINPAGTLLAIGAYTEVKVYEIVPTRGPAVLTPLYTFEHGLSNQRVWDIAFDSADNLYIANDNGAGVAYFALPKKDNSFTTEAPTNQALTIDALTGVKSIDARQVADIEYVNLQGQRSTTPWQGVNVVITRYSDGTTNTSKIVK